MTPWINLTCFVIFVLIGQLRNGKFCLAVYGSRASELVAK